MHSSVMKGHVVTMSTLHCMKVWTPGVITLWEALLTVLQYGLLLLHVYAQDKRWPYVSIPLYDHDPKYYLSFTNFSYDHVQVCTLLMFVISICCNQCQKL